MNAVGWYSVKGSSSSSWDSIVALQIQISEIISDNPIFMHVSFDEKVGEEEEAIGESQQKMQIDTANNDNTLPFKVYEKRGDGQLLPTDSPIKIEMSDTERLCVKELATATSFDSSSGGGSSGGVSMTQNFLGSQIRMLELLLQRVKNLCDFLDKDIPSSPDKLTLDQMDILRSINGILNKKGHRKGGNNEQVFQVAYQKCNSK